MGDNFIRIDFSHEQKGILTTCTFTEYKHYFLDGFSDWTLQGEYDGYIADLKKAINAALKYDSTMHTMIDISFNDRLFYRLLVEYDGAGEKNLYILKFDPMYSSYISKDKTDKKTALNTLKVFYSAKVREAAKTA